jgi:hypothetical protein
MLKQIFSVTTMMFGALLLSGQAKAEQSCSFTVCKYVTTSITVLDGDPDALLEQAIQNPGVSLPERLENRYVILINDRQVIETKDKAAASQAWQSLQQSGKCETMVSYHD